MAWPFRLLDDEPAVHAGREKFPVSQREVNRVMDGTGIASSGHVESRGCSVRLLFASAVNETAVGFADGSGSRCQREPSIPRTL